MSEMAGALKEAREVIESLGEFSLDFVNDRYTKGGAIGDLEYEAFVLGLLKKIDDFNQQYPDLIKDPPTKM